MPFVQKIKTSIETTLQKYTLKNITVENFRLYATAGAQQRFERKQQSVPSPRYSAHGSQPCGYSDKRIHVIMLSMDHHLR